MDTPIALAARENHLEVVKFLSQFTDDPNAGNDQGKTPIHYAAEEGHLDVIKILVPLTNNPNPHDETGETPLHLACRDWRWRKNNGNGESFLKIVEYLLPYSNYNR